MPTHSAAFTALRDLILDELEDADRARLAALLGSMRDPQPELSPAVVRALAAIVALEPADRKRLSAWFSQFMNRWGQSPVAASRRASKAAEKR